MVDFPEEALDLAYGEITTETVRLLRSTALCQVTMMLV